MIGKAVRAIPITVVHATIREEIVDWKGMNSDVPMALVMRGDLTIVTRYQTVQTFKTRGPPSMVTNFATPMNPGLGATQAASNLLGPVIQHMVESGMTVIVIGTETNVPSEVTEKGAKEPRPRRRSLILNSRPQDRQIRPWEEIPPHHAPAWATTQNLVAQPVLVTL